MPSFDELVNRLRQLYPPKGGENAVEDHKSSVILSLYLATGKVSEHGNGLIISPEPSRSNFKEARINIHMRFSPYMLAEVTCAADQTEATVQELIKRLYVRAGERQKLQDERNRLGREIRALDKEVRVYATKGMNRTR